MKYVAVVIVSFSLIQAAPRSPVDPCLVPQRARAALISAQQPGGIEFLPEGLLCQRLPEGTREVAASLAGRSGREALDTLVKLDPRYEWRDQGGVPTLRPAAAWRDDEHFLGRHVDSLVVRNENLGIALNQISTRIAGFIVSGNEFFLTPPSGQTLRPFSVELTDTTILDALGAIARAHGAMVWELSYCKPAARVEFATLWLRTFDGGGESIHTSTLEETGRMRDRCESAVMDER